MKINFLEHTVYFSECFNSPWISIFKFSWAINPLENLMKVTDLIDLNPRGVIPPKVELPESHRMPVTHVAEPFLTSGPLDCAGAGFSFGGLSTRLVECLCEHQSELEPQLKVADFREGKALLESSVLPVPLLVWRSNVSSSFVFTCFCVFVCVCKTLKQNSDL